VNQTSPANNSNFSVGNVNFSFNATSRVNATLSCNITLGGSVVYQNTSVISNITTTHTENIGSAGIKYWNVTCEDFYMETTSQTKWVNITEEPDTDPPTYSLNSTNSTNKGEYVEHHLYWQDSSGLSGYVFSFDNCTGTLVNDSWVSFSTNPDWSNKTKKANYTESCTIQWCVYANDTGGYWNSTSCSSPFSYQTTQGVYIAISFTATLDSGVTFGSLGPGTSNSSSTSCVNSACNVTVSGDTSVNVDIVARAGAYLTRWGGSETIEEYYWNSSNESQPAGPINKLQTSYDYTHKVAFNTTNGSNTVFGSWLSVDTGQFAGLYNNTVYFCATETGTTDC
jgi:hypothetical protein